MINDARHLVDRAQRLARWGRPRDAAAAFREACAADPDVGTRYIAEIGLAQSLYDAGDVGAIEVCRSAILRAPDRSEGHAALAFMLSRIDALDGAASAAAEACRLSCNSPPSLVLAASIALRRGRIDNALEMTAFALRLDPSFQQARALQWIAQSSRSPDGAMAEAKRLIRISEASPPPGFATLKEFNRTLSEAVVGSDRLDPGTGTEPLVGGERLHDLAEASGDLANQMRAIFEANAKSYAEELHQGRDAGNLSLDMWANVFSPGSYELPHIHERSWLSAVYYPQLPDSGSSGGEIQFGQSDLGPTIPPCAYRITPTIGMMIVFPSWLYHSTVPFVGSGKRVSVAADLVPSQ